MVAILIVAGIFAYYMLEGQSPLIRVGVILLSVLLAVLLGYFTEAGKRLFIFAQESKAEALKVIWPTRKESFQMTGVVFAFVSAMSLFLWLVDTGLLFVVQKIMGSGE